MKKELSRAGNGQQSPKKLAFLLILIPVLVIILMVVFWVIFKETRKQVEVTEYFLTPEPVVALYSVDVRAKDKRSKSLYELS